MRKLMLFGILATLLVSCATYQKKLNKFQTFALNNPGELAKLCSEKFPVKIITKPGRIDTVPGEVIYLPGDSIPCPDGTKVKAPDKKIHCPPSTRCTPDTVQIEDTAKLFVALEQRDKIKDSLNIVKGELKSQKEQTEAQRKTAKSRLWIIIALAGAISAGIIAKFRGWL